VVEQVDRGLPGLVYVGLVTFDVAGCEECMSDTLRRLRMEKGEIRYKKTLIATSFHEDKTAPIVNDKSEIIIGPPNSQFPRQISAHLSV
jgi:hypothetical protein